nr:sulfite exporter TauE/SafE family protein [Acidobacteriota bacterium]
VMNRLRMPLGFLCLVGISARMLGAHPMGNFSVNHYARIEVRPKGVDVRYVLDLAEIPTFELMQQWKLQASSPKPELEAKAVEQAREWVGNLSFAENRRALNPRFEGAQMTTADGAGGLPVMRIVAHLKLPATAGKLEYEDRNFPGRAGWKEIVIAAADGATLEKASQGSQDRSAALTAYPQDPTLAPPQDLKASLDWSSGDAPPAITKKKSEPKVVPVPQPEQPPVVAQNRPAPLPSPVATAPTPPEAKSMGTVTRGDFLSRTLRGNGKIGWGLGLLCIAVAFGLGALHAFEPGHGKTMVAAYLVGSRGTVKQAIFLGGMVTFTHTISVFVLGFATLFLSRYIMPDKITKVLGVLSGVSIIWIGGLLLYRRARNLGAAAHVHHHDATAHQPAHTHDHVHAHAHNHGEHTHTHEGHAHEPHSHTPEAHTHGAHTHTHDGRTHSHVPEGDVSLGSLIALGASGGLVPCPSALVLLLSAISIGRIGLGLLLLVGFSIGLAIVLMATGMFVLFAKNLLPERHRDAESPFFRLLPVLSAAVIVCIGVLMMGVSLGVIPATRFLG